MSFPNSPPVLIIGAGIAGLTLARTLRTHNIPSPVFNASASSRRQGFGITLRSWAYDRLQTDNMKLIEAAAVDGKMGGKGFISTDLIDIESGKVLSIPGPRVNAEEAAAKPQEHFRANRFRLREFLRDGIDVHWEHKLISFGPGEDGKGVLAIFADKTQVAGSLLVGADGVFSTGKPTILRIKDITNAHFLRCDPRYCQSSPRKYFLCVFITASSDCLSKNMRISLVPP